MRILKEQTGSAVIVALIVLFLAVAGAAGYKVYSDNKGNKLVPVSESTATSANNDKKKGALSGEVFCTQKIDPQPCATSIDIRFSATNSGSRVVTTDARGHFSVDLEPGTYTLIPESKSGYPLFTPPLEPVEIKAGQATKVTITYHDGTR